MTGNNEKIKKVIEERLEQGNIKFNQEMPLDGQMNRDNAQELYEEVMDSLLYCAALIQSDITTKEKYKKAYHILMGGFDSMPRETREKIHKQLEEINL